MRQTREAEIGPQPVEQRQRYLLVGLVQLDPVGQLVADIGEVGVREVARDILRADPLKPRGRLSVEHVGEGDLLVGRLHIELDRVVALDQFQLRAQIGAEQLRARDRGGIGALGPQPAERPALRILGFASVVMEQ